MNLLSDFLPIITLILGALLGVLTSMIARTFAKKDQFSEVLFSQFIAARNYVCGFLGKLAGIDNDFVEDQENVNSAKKDAIGYFYRYYDFLPERVLSELLCLYLCLNEGKDALYIMSCDHKVKRLKNDNDVIQFLKEIAYIYDSEKINFMRYKSPDINNRKSACINFQANKVVKVFNDQFTLKYFYKIHKNLSKGIANNKFVKAKNNRALPSGRSALKEECEDGG